MSDWEGIEAEARVLGREAHNHGANFTYKNTFAALTRAYEAGERKERERVRPVVEAARYLNGVACCQPGSTHHLVSGLGDALRAYAADEPMSDFEAERQYDNAMDVHDSNEGEATGE